MFSFNSRAESTQTKETGQNYHARSALTKMN